MNSYQKEAATTIEMMVKAGVVKRAVLFSSDVKNGQYEVFNGAYLDGTIYVDINAGKLSSSDNRRMILQTFAHELTHSLENTEAYTELSKFVLDHIGEEQLEEIKRRLLNTGMYSEDELQHEIVANACAEVLYDSTAIQAMAQENRTLYERVREFIRGLIKKIRNVYQQENSFRQESVLMRDVSERLADLWDTALLEKLNQQNSSSDQKDAEYMYREGRIEQDELDAGITAVASMRTVYSLKGYEGSLKASDIVRTIGKYYESLGGVVENPQLGDVKLSKRGIKADLAHGIGREKVAAFVAVPDILQQGRVVDYQINWKGRGYDTAVVAAPIEIDGTEYMAGVLLKRTNSENKFYIHEVLAIKKETSPFNQAALLSGDVDSGGDIPSINKILQRIVGVNDEISERQKVPPRQTEFSMRESVEQVGNLLALHNLTEQNLLDTIRLGGFPMPSIAVVKADAGHSKYGPISIVLSSGSIDPEADSRNHVYGGDAWTPTAPNVEYPVNSKKARQVEQMLDQQAKKVAGGIFGNTSVLRAAGIDESSNMSAETMADRLADNDTVRAAYLADQGETLEPTKMAKVWNRKFGNDVLNTVIDRIGVQELAGIQAQLEQGESIETALGEHRETLNAILHDYYKKLGEPLLRKMAVAKKWTAEEISEKREARIANSMSNLSVFQLEDLIRNAWAMYEDGGQTKGEIDRMATRDALQAKTDRAKVKQWLLGQLDGLLGEPGIYNGKDRFTASGNRRSFASLHYAYTAENIVRAMTQNQRQRGEGVWGHDSKAMMSTATPEYSDIDSIRSDSGRLQQIDEQEYNDLLSDLDEDISSVIQQVRKQNKPHADNSYEEEDIIGSILIDAATGKQTSAAIVRAFSKEGYTIDKDTAKRIQALYHSAAEMPTGYFEAKPERVVNFDEVLAVVVPDNINETLLQQIQATGMPVKTYVAGDEQSRLQAVNAVEGAKFSIREAIDENGNVLQYVQFDRLQLEGNDVQQMEKQVEQYINDTIRGGEDIIIPTTDGQFLRLTARSAYKLSDPHMQSRKAKDRPLMSADDYGVKARAASHIDELALVGIFDVYQEDLNGAHENDIGEDGFTYYTSFFMDADGQFYKISISAGVNGTDETIYSIGEIEKRNLPYRHGSSGGVDHGSDRSQLYSPLDNADALSASPGALIGMQKTSFDTNDNIDSGAVNTSEQQNFSAPQLSQRVYSATDDEILSDLDTSTLTTQAEREAYFRWERRRSQYQNWQNKMDELQREYDSIEDKSSGRARNISAQMSQYMPQIDNAMQRAEEALSKSKALQDVLARERADRLLQDTKGKHMFDKPTQFIKFKCKSVQVSWRLIVKK